MGLKNFDEFAYLPDIAYLTYGFQTAYGYSYNGLKYDILEGINAVLQTTLFHGRRSIFITGEK